ncbi:MAG: hypothetical protein LBK13_09415 [Spirochaetales bacterium]|nr:hypothetical protein [Spirochaetales bacterium]
MLEIKYTLYDETIDQEIVLECGTHLIALIEGDLKIIINDILFFDEPYMNLLELSVQLYKWLHKVIKNDFMYNSINNEEPVLNFHQINNKYWGINSIWEKCNSFNIRNSELYKCLRTFIKSLDKDLLIKYGIKTIDIIKAKKYIP